MWRLLLIIISSLLLIQCHSVQESTGNDLPAPTLFQIKSSETEKFPDLDVLAYQVFADDGKVVPHQGNGQIQRHLTGIQLEEVFKNGIQEELPNDTYHMIVTGYSHKQGTFSTLRIIDFLTDTLWITEDGKPINGDFFFGTGTFSSECTTPIITLKRKVGKVTITLNGEAELLSKVSQVTMTIPTDEIQQAFLANDTYLNLPIASNTEYSQIPDENHQISFYSLPTTQATGSTALIHITFDGSEPDKMIYILPEEGFYIAANHTTHIHLHLSSEHDPLHPNIQVDTSWTSVYETNIDGEIYLDPVPVTGFKLKISIPDGWDFHNTSQNTTGAKSMYDFDYFVLQDRNADIPSMRVPIHTLDERTVITDIITCSPTILTPYSWMITPKSGGSAIASLGVHNIKWTLPVVKDKIRTYAIMLTKVAEDDIQLILEEEIIE